MHSAADQLKIFGTVGCAWTRMGKGEMVWIPLGWCGAFSPVNEKSGPCCHIVTFPVPSLKGLEPDDLQLCEVAARAFEANKNLAGWGDFAAFAQDPDVARVISGDGSRVGSQASDGSAAAVQVLNETPPA
eukprot:10181397-Alexandrium_andersonii.AAC.1